MRLKYWLPAATLAAVAAVVGVMQLDQHRERERFAALGKYCSDCHNPADLAGELSFEGLTLDEVPQHAEQFEAAIVKLRGRLMPPPGNPQPTADEVDGLIASLERTIDEHAPPTAGYVAAQRLSRTEYAHAVKALLDVEIDPKEYLPSEIEIHGFTNIAAALSTSPAFVEQYVNAASAVAHLAVGEPKPKVANAYFPPPGPGTQNAYVAGAAARHARRHEVHAHVPGRRRVPYIDRRRPRRRAVPARRRDAAHARRARRPQRAVPRRHRRRRGLGTH